jgi:hypothetical protein
MAGQSATLQWTMLHATLNGSKTGVIMKAFDRIVEFLDAEEVRFEQTPEEFMVRFNFTGESGSWFVLGSSFPEANRVIFLSILPSLVPAERKAAVGEFINRINFGLVVGNLEIDMDGGEVRFRTSMDLDDVEVSVEMIRNLLYANVYMTDVHLPIINKVAFGDLDPIAAMTLSEERINQDNAQ